MNLFVSTCIVLLVILATMHYLAKVKSENLGPFFKWIGYLVLLAAACMLIGLMFKGIKKVTRYGRGHSDHQIHMEHRKSGEKAKKRSYRQSMHHEEMSSSGNHCCCYDACCDTISESSMDTIDG